MVSTTKTSMSVDVTSRGAKRRGRRCSSSRRSNAGVGTAGERRWVGVRPMERQLMRPWLIEQIDSKEIAGLAWVDVESRTTFKVPWKHGSRQGWNCNKDACLFRRWAQHTGRYRENEHPNPKRWKANFRCAINSLPDAEEVKGSSQTRGHNAFRVYRFLQDRKPKKVSTSTGQQTSTLPVFSKVKVEPDTVPECMDTSNDHVMSKEAWYPDTPESLSAADSDDCPDQDIKSAALPGTPSARQGAPAISSTPDRFLDHHRSSSNLISERMPTQPNLYGAGSPGTPPRWMHLSGGSVHSAPEPELPLAHAPTPASTNHRSTATLGWPSAFTVAPPRDNHANYAAFPASAACSPTTTSPPPSCELSFHFAVTGPSNNRSDSVSSVSCSSCSQDDCRSDEEMYDSSSNISTEVQNSDVDEVLDELFPSGRSSQQLSSCTERPPPTPFVENVDVHNLSNSLQSADLVLQDDPGLPGITSFLDLNFHIFINTGGLSGNEVAAYIDDDVSAALAH